MTNFAKQEIKGNVEERPKQSNGFYTETDSRKYCPFFYDVFGYSEDKV